MDSPDNGVQATSISYPKGVFSSLGNRNFRYYWIGQCISLMGTWMQSTAQSWLVFQLTNSSFYLGVVSALASLPILLFSFFGGALADRFPKRKLLLFTQSALAFQAILLGALALTGIVQVWHIMILAFFLGIMNALDGPTRQSFLFELVGKDLLMNAIGLNSISFNIARIIGPSIAGILIGLVGVPACFFINGLSFFATIAALLLMKISDRVPPRKENENILSSIKEGVRFAYSRQELLYLLIIVAICSVFAFPYATLMPIFAQNVLKSGPTGLGGLMSAVGVGALLGAINTASMRSTGRRGMIAIIGNSLLSIFLILFAFSRTYWISLIFLAGVGMSMITQNTSVNTLLQVNTPDHLRGRVMSLYTLAFNGMSPLGSFLAGSAAEFIGAPATVFCGAMINGLTVLFIAWRHPEIRKLP